MAVYKINEEQLKSIIEQTLTQICEDGEAAVMGDGSNTTFGAGDYQFITPVSTVQRRSFAPALKRKQGKDGSTSIPKKKAQDGGVNETKSYHVNMDVELAKPGRTAPKISAEDFSSHMRDYIIKHLSTEGTYSAEKAASYKDNPDKKVKIGDFMYAVRTSDCMMKDKEKSNLNKDLNKIDHDYENMDHINSDIRMTKSGIPYILGHFGGDWEDPILFMIYWDGKEFRGYVPKHGNCFNRDTNTAFGNNDEADEKFIMKNVTNNDGDYSKIHRHVSYNKDECIKDFESRLQVSKKKINEDVVNDGFRHFEQTVADCEHTGDLARSERHIANVIRKYGGRVEGRYWDGQDCGEAYISYKIPNERVQEFITDMRKNEETPF